MPMETMPNTEQNFLPQTGMELPESLNPNGYTSLNDVLELALTKYADHPAFTSVGRTITYRELDEKSNDFAAYIQHETDLVPGDRIAIQLPNVIQYPVVMFGAIKAGLMVVNTNPLYTPKELEHQFKDAGVKALVVFANMAHNVEKILDKTSIKHLIITQIADFHSPVKRLLINAVVKHVKKMVPAYQLPNAISLNSALAKGRGKHVERFNASLDTTAVLQYTGGTTGVAKGAMLSHANLLSNMYQLSSRIDSILVDGKETYIAPLPLYHIYAFLIHGLTLLERGGHSVLIPNPRDLTGFVKELKQWKFTGFSGLNTLFVALCNREDFHHLDFSALTMTCSGGMPLTEAAANEWKKVTGCQIVEGYGLTETSPLVSFNPIGKERLGTIGVPVAETDIKIQDNQGNRVAQGEAGMLCVRGPQVMKGYWNQVEETRNVMTDDGFLITGDIAMQHDDGYYQIVDRAKDMIIVSGFNVFPTEVEDCLASHPDVLESAAIGIPDDKTGEAVKAFVVLKKGIETLDIKSLRAYCKKELAAYKVPTQVEIRLELPKTNVGKVLRRGLREEESELALES